jgi:hypothetical protein
MAAKPKAKPKKKIVKPTGWQRQRPMRVGDKFTSRQHGKKVILQCTGVMPSYKAKRIG